MKVFYQLLTLFLTSNQLLNAQYATKLVVAQDGSGDYSSIQAAIDNTKSFPDQAVTIFIRKGIYKEKARVYPWNTNLSLIGEDKSNTIITFDDHFKRINRGRNSTFHTYTLAVEANDVTLKNLSIINEAGAVGQAIALSISGDRCIVENCNIIGHQDALYCTGEQSRQYFKNCKIEGTTDFIFGNATALFEYCEIQAKANSYITAASTTSRQEYGLVFKNCTLTAADGINSVYLGRPWRAYAKTIFINCTYGDHIVAEGWKAWSNKEDLTTTFYAEYPKPKSQNRVSWSKTLHKRTAKRYTTSRIFRGWKP